ncbi:TPA: conjugal transfer protein TraM, partial [Klebsiella pneumoniae]|nr:conjugal transfer protein TraM [Klebsiella pneumoniae]
HGNPRWEWSGLIENIRDDVNAVIEQFFPKVDDTDND